VAFPKLPKLPRLPKTVNPDAWVYSYDKRVFRRKVAQNGSVEIGKHCYYIDYRLAGASIGVHLDAKQAVFNVIYRGQVIRQLEVQGLVKHTMNFQDFVQHMLQQAHTNSI